MKIRDRLAAARTPEAVALILGRRRLIAYTGAFALLAMLLLAQAGYGLAEVVTGNKSAWTLLMLPALLSLVLFFGYIAAAGIYFNVTGRRWPKVESVERLARRLNSNI